LVRKKQVPDKKYSSKDVIRICLAALQNNDDPQLDHGSCVVLAFKSPQGPLAQGNLDPSGYGRFLRTTTPYNVLLDFKSAEVVGDSQELGQNVIKQAVLLKSYGGYAGGPEDVLFDFYMSRVEDTWLIDVILATESKRT
jgi:hypothetical protein